VVEGEAGEGLSDFDAALNDRGFRCVERLGDQLAMPAAAKAGVSSEGLSITRLPAARASIIGPAASISG